MKKISFTLLLFLLFTGVLTSCDDNGGTEKTPTLVEPSPQTPTPKPTEGETDGETQAPTENTPTIDDETSEIQKYINIALQKLDEIVNPVIAKITHDDLKTSVQNFYNTEKQYINGIKDLETAKEAATKVVADAKAFVVSTLKPLAIEKLNGLINPLIQKITHEELKDSVQEFYELEITKINTVESLDDLVNVFNEIVDDTKKFIADETEKIVIALKNKAIEELDPYVVTLIAKIPYDTLKEDTQEFYVQEKQKLEAVNTIEGFEPCVKEIKADLEEFALTETKKIAISKLEEVVEAGLDKIPNPEIKADLEEFADIEIAKINSVNKIEDVPATLETVIKETEAHIKELLVNTVKEYVKRLTKVETANAYDYLPEAMSPMYEGNIVNSSDINYDFTQFTNVSNINQLGFGEQWQMVIENINQSIAMAKVFNIAQTILNAAGNAVDIYITNSYAEEMDYNFSGDGFNGEFSFINSKLIFNINITKSVDVPVCGSIKPIIKMEYDLEKDAKGIYINLGEAYKVKYVISNDSYEMATTYGITVSGKNVSRSSYLSIVKSDNITIGHIYEYTTLENSDKIKASADFYIENGYVSVVGNKASGMVAFDGYVNELYSANNGKLLGYEVREELTFAGVKGTYNTLWFNLWDIQGINNVKITEKTSANKSSKSVYDVYLNDSSKLLSPTYNSKLGVKTSRKYDIELRTRFYYTYDSINDEYVANEVLIPMMFIQEGDNFESFVNEVKEDNDLNLLVSLNQSHLNKILIDYDTLIDIFILNKELMSSETIINYLKQYE